MGADAGFGADSNFTQTRSAGRAGHTRPAETKSGMPKRARGVDADADTPVSEDTLKAPYKLLCKAYVSVSVEDVPACDQLKHHVLWVHSRPATRLALLATRTRRGSTRCAFRSCAPAGGGPQDPLRTLRHSDCEHAARRVDEGVPGVLAKPARLSRAPHDVGQDTADWS